MIALEDRLRAALRDGAAAVHDSPDLFARVLLSIEDDRLRRRRRARAALIAACLAGATAALTVAVTEPSEGKLLMDWWVLELMTTALLVVIALWLGPFIKRFGRAYAADVFHDNPMTGKSYIVLTDIVYYLIFSAYILFTVRVEAPAYYGGDVHPDLVKVELVKIGGILLIIGVLHGLNIVIMPVLGRLFSLNRRLPPRLGE